MNEREPRPPHQVKAVTGSLSLGPIHKTRHTSTQFPAFSIQENSFRCAPAPTPKARPASDAGPSPQRPRKKAQCFIHKKGKKKKPQGAASQRKKPTSFIKSPTFIKTSCGARRYQPPPIGPPPKKKHPSKHLSLAPLHNQDFGSPRGPLPSENAVRSQIQREAPASLHPPPSAPIFFLFHHPQAAVLMLSYFSRIAMQPDALSLLGVGVGGLGVRFPHPETCKAFISSWPTPNPGGCTCLCHLTPPGAGVGVHHSQTFPLRCFSPPPPPSKDLPSASSREPPSPLGALRSPETKARNSPPLHLHPGASAPRAPARLPRDVRKPALR